MAAEFIGVKADPTNLGKTGVQKKIEQEETIHFKTVSTDFFWHEKYVLLLVGFLFCFEPSPHN